MKSWQNRLHPKLLHSALANLRCTASGDRRNAFYLPPTAFSTVTVICHASPTHFVCPALVSTSYPFYQPYTPQIGPRSSQAPNRPTRDRPRLCSFPRTESLPMDAAVTGQYHAARELARVADTKAPFLKTTVARHMG